MAGRRRRSRVFVDVQHSEGSPAEAPTPDDEDAPSADKSSPSFVITPMPQTTTEPMRIVPPRPRPPKD